VSKIDETHICYLLEHAAGCTEVWVRERLTAGFQVSEPFRFTAVSGPDGWIPTTDQIADAIQLDEWAADHLQVFTDGTISPDRQED